LAPQLSARVSRMLGDERIADQMAVGHRGNR
jgi:hypothetical protein